MKASWLAAALLMSTLSFAGKSLADEDKRKPDDPDYGVTYSTKLDFDSTLIDGKMKAPAGFFLQGRTGQSLTNLVKLRSNFKTELRNSRAAVKAMVR
jgi:hypothetical protein